MNTMNANEDIGGSKESDSKESGSGESDRICQYKITQIVEVSNNGHSRILENSIHPVTEVLFDLVCDLIEDRLGAYKFLKPTYCGFKSFPGSLAMEGCPTKFAIVVIDNNGKCRGDTSGFSLCIDSELFLFGDSKLPVICQAQEIRPNKLFPHTFEVRIEPTIDSQFINLNPSPVNGSLLFDVLNEIERLWVDYCARQQEKREGNNTTVFVNKMIEDNIGMQRWRGKSSDEDSSNKGSNSSNNRKDDCLF